MVLCRMVWECLMEAKRRFSSRRPSKHPLHGRNDMKTSKKRFSRQKHAHKQRKKGLSCHHAPPQSPQPSQEPRTPSIVSTVFNSPNGPIGPKSPKSHNGPKDGCSPSIPIPQLSVKNQKNTNPTKETSTENRIFLKTVENLPLK